ncbi:alcohol dehydrogenase catalytic domain-containing protein [Paracoccus sp. MA]|uniref:alcohol dehydrogenase catalytic domain-containing protein n=1 Tax=Paracoccus sp. MA TaxID=2895796 RepID=UPI001E2FDE73|nr:alcohol dehydrogenase catalytic domain-containing protein [Paracoccus sp. MA]UFM64490.1 alcohol dehydrogenase catalytic domain-containing protein [Paracoccus sp. MA]
MTATYRAMQIAEPGRLELVERPVPQPQPGHVLIAVEACGICGADSGDIEHGTPGRIPGHEVVGRIAKLGEGVPPIWRIGQRVGVGRFGGHCETCRECRRGRFHLCRNQPVLGASCDGGYAEMTGARPMIETMPLERAMEAYRKMRSGDVKFRMVLTMKEHAHAHQ